MRRKAEMAAMPPQARRPGAARGGGSQWEAWEGAQLCPRLSAAFGLPHPQDDACPGIGAPVADECKPRGLWSPAFYSFVSMGS